MLFDKLCGVVERFFPDKRTILEEAKLFTFDKIPHEHLSKTKPDFDLDLFALPFPITAIEDAASLIILIDSQVHQTGLNIERNFIEFMEYGKNSEAFSNINLAPQLREHHDEYMQMLDQLKGYLVVNEGVVREVVADETQWLSDTSLKQIHLIDRSGKLRSTRDPSEIPLDDVKAANGNVITALEELMTLFTPERFILETKPVLTDKQARLLAKGKKIPRSDQRPIYTILTPGEIRDKIEVKLQDQIDKKSPIPHERRAHLRRLRKESGYKEDKIIRVKASWIGVSEKTVGNKRYRVVLE
jgi:hypothetical protein